MIATLSKVTSTVRFYGHSMAPKRIAGDFSIERNGVLLGKVVTFEGHVNSSGVPQRLVSFADQDRSWAMTELCRDIESESISFVADNYRADLYVVRTVSEIVGQLYPPLACSLFKGRARMMKNHPKAWIGISTYSLGEGTYYLDGPLEQLLAIKRRVDANGLCEIDLMPVIAKED
jgi:hypothetical protein